MSNWRLAKSLTKLRDQINAAYPQRSKVSDGTIGDTAHQKAGTSDHLPNGDGVVTAIDITHSPATGFDARDLADTLVESQDRRIKYIIYNKRMVGSYPAHGKPAWTWRPYTGSNPHTKHVHISVNGSKSLYDSAIEWALPESEPEIIKNGHVEPALPVAEPAETVSEKTITTTTTETPDATVEKKSIVSSFAANATVKEVATAGVSKLGNRVATGLATGSATSVLSGFFERNMGLIIFGCVLIVLAAGIVGVVLWHRSTQQKKVIDVNSDREKDDVVIK